MKNILGLDLGSGSIGWSVIQEGENNRTILGMGSRIIPLSPDDTTQFTQGKSITKNADRTAFRTQRKGYDRYQLRRHYLTQYLHKLGMLPDERLIKLPQTELWEIRAKAVNEKIELPELGRVLYHLNQKRGYKSGKSDFQDKKSSKYLSEVSERYKKLQEKDITIGQKFYAELKADPTYRCKDRVYPRIAYIEEFDRIMECQRKHHDILTDEHIAHLRNHIIYYQRPLKSCKHLVGECSLAQMTYRLPDGSIKSRPIKVAPKSSPLFQVCKIWESINHINLQRDRERFEITPAHRQALFTHMNSKEKLKINDLYKILGIKKHDGWWGGKAIGNGLQGNTTVIALQNALTGYSRADELLRFELKTCEIEIADPETGEIATQLIIDPAFEQEPLYRLWHTLYSISDTDVLDRILERKFGIEDPEMREKLTQIDFTKSGYGNLSSIAMRRILPYLRQGYVYSEACFMAGYNHSNSITREENLARELAEHLRPITKGELRQPIVEKILNQMVNLVNALIDRYGRFDEIRVELARELQQSREERDKTYKKQLDNQKRNEEIRHHIEEMDLSPTRSRIQKYRMYEESHHLCIYCGQPVGLAAFLQGYDTEVEHIIPRSLYFDDSYNNKVCACRACNQAKNNRTAYDYMSSLPEETFHRYLDRIKNMHDNKEISDTKYKYLLTKGDEIPQDFLNRQMRESQYISRKAIAMLQEVCHHVYATSGSVTAYLRHVWGWDNVLHDLNRERYRAGGLTEMREIDNRTVECIKDWNKRLDHRHHAIDALAIACTRQGYIQRINTLSKQAEEGDLVSLERYIRQQPHFSYAEVCAAAEKILVSFKAGKRVATKGKRYIYRGGKRILAQEDITVPRGALSEQSVYGQIAQYRKDKKGKVSFSYESVLKYPIESIDTKTLPDVVDAGIRRILQQRLDEHGGNAKEAFATPVYTASGHLIRTVRCFTRLKAVVPVKYDASGKAVGFVKPGNNHHVAIYIDRDGKPQEHIVTFWHAVERKKYGLPVIIERPGEAWDAVTDTMPDSFLEQLPDATWQFRLSMQQNEMFILGMPDELYADALENRDYALLGKYLYRVQKISTKYYCFRHHIETSVDDKYNGKKNEKLSTQMGKYKLISSISALYSQHPHKVKISLTGEICEI